MKILEVLIACTLFVAMSNALSLLLFSTQSFLEWSRLHQGALALAGELIEEASVEVSFTEDSYSVQVEAEDIDNFTRKMEVRVGYTYHGRPQEVLLFLLAADTSESEGQSSCRPVQNTAAWVDPLVSSFDLASIAPSLKSTDIDMVGDYLFVSSNATTASSSDLFIFNVSDTRDVRLVSILDTGPGIAALSATGKHVYAANTSINGQLQVIDTSDLSHPRLISNYKLPGEYDDGTTVGNALFYKAGKIFLGTQKSQVAELHHIDVSDPNHPREVDSREIGNAVNDIFAFKDKVYVASPHSDEMKAFSVSLDGFLSPFISYNDPGSTGNGKRLSLFLSTLYVGKTQTFAREEVLALSASSSPRLHFGLAIGSSVQGLIGYGSLLFVIPHRSTESFLIYDVASSTPRRLNKPISIPFAPLNFDCDRDTFAVVSEDSALITFIKPR